MSIKKIETNIQTAPAKQYFKIFKEYFKRQSSKNPKYVSHIFLKPNDFFLKI